VLVTWAELIGGLIAASEAAGRKMAVVAVKGTLNRSNNWRAAGSSAASRRVGSAESSRCRFPIAQPMPAAADGATVSEISSTGSGVCWTTYRASVDWNTVSPCFSGAASSKPNSVPSSAVPRQRRLAMVRRSTRSVISGSAESGGAKGAWISCSFVTG